MTTYRVPDPTGEVLFRLLEGNAGGGATHFLVEECQAVTVFDAEEPVITFGTGVHEFSPDAGLSNPSFGFVSTRPLTLRWGTPEPVTGRGVRLRAHGTLDIKIEDAQAWATAFRREGCRTPFDALMACRRSVVGALAELTGRESPPLDDSSLSVELARLLSPRLAERGAVFGSVDARTIRDAA